MRQEWWVHPSVVARLRKCSEDEARAWLQDNGTLIDGCWVIRREIPEAETVNLDPDGTFMGVPIKKND